MAKSLIAQFDDKEVKRFLKSLDKNVKKVKNKTKEYGKFISPIIFADVMDHFAREEGSDGRWQEWSLGYAIRMKKKGKSGNKILQDTGKLRQSFLPGNFKKTSLGYIWFNRAKTKSGFPYAAAHDDGGPILPQRQFMWLSDDAYEDITKATLAFVMKK